MLTRPEPSAPQRRASAGKERRRGRLRVALVAPPWFQVPPDGYGGIEQMCGELANGLVARGHDVTLFAAGEDRTSARFVRTFEETPAGLGTLDGASVELLHTARTEAELQRMDVDIVHDHTFAGPLMTRHRDASTVVTAHGPIPPGTADLYREVGRLSLVAISDSQRRGWPSLPWVATVYNGIEVDSYPFSEAKEDFVLFLGRMHPDKGVHHAIDVARAAGRHLVIAAKCSEPVERRYLESEVRPRLGPDVDYVGPASAEVKRDLLMRASALLFPIQWEEPFGLVMVEAMACGTPVVALRRGSVPEIVAHGITGFVCDDLDEMIAASDKIGELEQRACREHARAWFDDDVMVQRYEAVYRTVLAGRVGRPDDVAEEPTTA